MASFGSCVLLSSVSVVRNLIPQYSQIRRLITIWRESDLMVLTTLDRWRHLGQYIQSLHRQEGQVEPALPVPGCHGEFTEALEHFVRPHHRVV